MAIFEFRASGVAAALLCGLAGAPSCTAGAQSPPASAASAVTLAISFPADVTVNHMASNAGEQVLPETAQLTLTNASPAAVTLQASNECESHLWIVTDTSGNTIDGRNICPMIFLPVDLPLTAHGTFTGTQTVSLASSRYRNGAHYTLHYAFWGVKADAAFTVHVTQ